MTLCRNPCQIKKKIVILDIHTHKVAPQPEAVIAVTPKAFEPLEGQLYSVGIHPWDTGTDINTAEWERLEEILQEPQVVAVGECGIDILKGGPLFRQMQIFKRHVELSEKYGKPMVIHDVKAHDIIIGIKKELKPGQPWVVHGFRGKPTVAKMLTDAGIYISFGEKFNPETVKSMPPDMMLAETDESTLTIEEIIQRISEAAGREVRERIIHNSQFIIHNENS